MRRLRSKALLTVAILGVLTASVAAQDRDPAPAEISSDGWMGLYIRTIDREDLEALDLDRGIRGVVVSGIDDEGPAAKAGIEPGDVITAFDGSAVRNRRDFMRQLERRAPGDVVRLSVLRDSGEKNLEFELEARPSELEERRAPLAPMFRSTPRPGSVRPLSFGGPALGVQTLELTNAALADYFGVQPGRGILVTEVIEESGAAKAGIEGGDVILAVGDREVDGIETLREALSEFREGDEVEVRVRRKKRDRTVKVELSEPSILSYSGLGMTRLPSRAFLGGDDLGDLRREIRDLKRDLQRLEREMRRR